MTPPIDLSDAISTGEGTVADKAGPGRTLSFTVGRPFCPDPALVTWYCSYRIELGDAQLVESSMAGTDGIEALTNALVALGLFVEDLRLKADVRFYGQPGFAPEYFLRAAGRPSESPE